MRYLFDSSFKFQAWISKNSFLPGSISTNFRLDWSAPILPLTLSSTTSSKTMRSVWVGVSCNLRPMHSKEMVRQDLSMMVSFSFFMLNSSLSRTARYFSLQGRKLRLLQLRWNCSMSCLSQASIREISSCTSFSFLKGIEASWQSELYLPSFLSDALSISKLMSTFVFRISFSSEELPYFAFSRKASATQSALFSKFAERNMPSAMANLSTEIWPSLIQASLYRVGILSYIQCNSSPMSLPVNLLCLISKLYSQSITFAEGVSSWLDLTSSNSASASLRSFSSMAFSKSIRQELTRMAGSSSAMKASRSVLILWQSLALSMATMVLIEFSVYFSCAFSDEMRLMVERRSSRRLFLQQICSSWLRIFTLQFLSWCSQAVTYSASNSSTALSNFPSLMCASISKYSSSTLVSAFYSSSACGSSSQTYYSSYSQSDISCKN